MEFTLLGHDVTAWQAFAAFGIIFIFLEVFAPGFVLLPIGIACILTILPALYFDNWLTQFICFGINLIIVFAVFVKVVRPRLKTKSHDTNVDSMIGMVAEVTEEIKTNHNGYVKLYGDRWQAYCQQADHFEIGERVKICALDGNKVIIKKIN